jgi:hypothetical protein
MTKLLHGSLEHKALDERLRAAAHTQRGSRASNRRIARIARRGSDGRTGDGVQETKLKKLSVRPGRLFMQTHWLMGRNSPPA